MRVYVILLLSLLLFSYQEIIENEDQCLKRPNMDSDEPFYFAPVLRAKLINVGDQFAFPSSCFKRNIATLKSMSDTSITITLENSESRYLICTDLMIFHTSNLNQVKLITFKGIHEITFDKVSQDDLDEISKNGIKIFSLCTTLSNEIKSLITTVKAFLGGLGTDPNHILPIMRPSIPEEMVEANLRLLKVYNNYVPKRRENKIVNFDKNIIKTGDFVAISRMDGLDPLIMVGAGGHLGHSGVCSWIDGELYVLESQDGWYWPNAGIQRTKWEQWIEWAYNADFNVAILPLKEEYRKKLDEKKANDWFINVAEGLPYGYHNFIFSWIDTVDKNFPFIVTHEVVEFLFSIISYVAPDVSDKMLTEAINIRLGTQGLTLQQAIAEGARQGKSFEEILAEPEIEGNVYSDGYNYVCTAFVVAFWKHGGMFGDLEINPNEFSPRDIYTMDIFDKEFPRPQECIDDNPDLPYCQLMGKFVVDLDNYSTIPPYSNMNERCPSIGPDFIREEGC
jgi:hypothetical protein